MNNKNLKKFYSVEEIQSTIPISKGGLYSAIKRKEIPSIRIGGRIFIPAWWLDEKIAEVH